MNDTAQLVRSWNSFASDKLLYAHRFCQEKLIV